MSNQENLRKRRITFRLSDLENITILVAAYEADMTVGEYCRRAALGKLDVSKSGVNYTLNSTEELNQLLALALGTMVTIAVGMEDPDQIETLNDNRRRILTSLKGQE